MADVIKGWARDLFIVVIILGFVEIVLPEGGMRKYIKFVFSIIIVGVILSPLSYFIGTDNIFQSLSDEYNDFFQESEGLHESDINNNSKDEAQSEKFNETQNLIIENVYREKIISEVKKCVNDYYPEIKIYDIEIYLNESGVAKENQLGSLNKVVIIGEETEYVSNIIRCVAQRLSVEDDRVSYINHL